MARPVKYNPARHADICKSLEAGMSRTTAAELVGINRDTLEVWRGRYPAFSGDVASAIAKAKARASVTITRAIQNGDVASAFRYLALQERSEWQEQRSADISIDVSIKITVEQRKLAEQIARQRGLDVDDVLAEVDQLLGMKS